MKIHDISLTISKDLPTWPGDPAVFLERVSKIEEGANANVSRLDIGVHTGTHLDAPYHFLADGITVESLPLDVLVGEAQVVRFADSVDVIGARELAEVGIAPGVTRLLLKTRNSRYWSDGTSEFQTGFVGLDEDGAHYLVQNGIRLVGIDYLSIAPFKQSRPTHEALLRHRIIVVEGVDLSRIQPGIYQLYCLPLKLAGSDGAPCRAVLIEG